MARLLVFDEASVTAIVPDRQRQTGCLRGNVPLIDEGAKAVALAILRRCHADAAAKEFTEEGRVLVADRDSDSSIAVGSVSSICLASSTRMH